MNSIILLSEGDRSTLSALLHYQLPGLIPHPRAHTTLLGFIGASLLSKDPKVLEHHVAFGDLVTLGTADDASAPKEIRLVLPAEARPGTERISVLTPLGLAVLGRKVGESVRWTAPEGQQLMTIREVRKKVTIPPSPC